MDTLDPKPRLARLLQQWSEILPRVRDYQVSALSHSWANDFWSMGGWAYPTKSQEKNLFDELRRKEGRIYFAGEHTASKRGWMEGALNSGLRAAQEFHRSS